jgi:hypothetical protein
MRERPKGRARALDGVTMAVAVLALAGCAGASSGGTSSATATVGSLTATASGSGSSTGDASTKCDLTGCTVTLQRGGDARVSVLGLDVQVTGTTGDHLTLRVGGQQATVPLTGQGSAQLAGLAVRVQSVDDSRIVLRISRS